MELSSSKKKTDPEYLHTLVMQTLNAPVVFHEMIEDWPASKWTPECLGAVLGDIELKIRIGLKEANQWGSTQWEADCSYVTTTLSNLCDWLNYDKHSDKPQNNPQDRHTKTNPLLQYNRDKYWCYMDYKYMAELFQEHPDILKAVRWSDFGFRNRDGQQSTVWIGSQGATTPGHYDTYGCNLVAQIYGRKKWHLFPPDQSDALYQTRIPYEESSVFSSININKPDLKKYPQFTAATPYIVTLDPGDVLFVPHHWWHFVETMETSVSVNTWIEMEEDHQGRFHEAVTRALVSEVLPSAAGNCGKSKWLNPTEELCSTATNMKYLKSSLDNLIKQQEDQGDNNSQEASLHRHTTDNKTSPESHSISQDKSNHSQGDNIDVDNSTDGELPTNPCSPVKRRKCLPVYQSFSDQNQLPDFVSPVCCLGQVYKVNENDCSVDNAGHNKRDVNVDDDTLELLVQAVTHPEVISLVGRLMRKKVQEKE